MTEEIGEWLNCVVDNDYEIYSEFPYPIRRKGRDRIIKDTMRVDGYVCCRLNSKTYLKHRVIGQQFIDNPDNLSQVDHINHNRADNRIENLRWVSHSENMRNISGYRQQYTYIDKLPETAEPLDVYNGHEFDGLFIDYENQKLYLFNDIKYRELTLLPNHDAIRYAALDVAKHCRFLSHKVLFG